MRARILLAALAALPMVHAHCPLCTVGAAAAAGGAAYLGVNQAAIGVFIGAFAVSMGWWASRMLKQEYVRGQLAILVGLSFTLTIWPMLAIMRENWPLPVLLWGEYGSLLNRTYVVNLFLVGSVIGGLAMFVTPWLSARLTEHRKRQIAYQGIVLTFIILSVLAGFMQVAL